MAWYLVKHRDFTFFTLSHTTEPISNILMLNFTEVLHYT